MNKLIMIAVVAATLSACGGALESQPDPDGSDDTAAGCEDCQPKWGIVDEEQPTPAESGTDDEQGPALEPGEISRALLPCGPQAQAFEPVHLPELPEDALDPHCPLEQQTIGVHGQSERLITYRWEGTTLVHEEVEGDDWRITTEFDFDDDLEQVRTIERHIRTVFSYAAPRERDSRWEFDSQGQLTFKSTTVYDGDGPHRSLVQTDYVEQTWEGDRLVHRVKTVDRPYFVTSTETRWTYDGAGRLQEVLHDRGGDRQTRSVWTWEGDRPAEVQRFVEDELTEHQVWGWDDHGLRSRTLRLNGDFDEIWGIHEDLRDHDNYAISMLDFGHGMSGSYPTAWAGANAHRQLEDGADCFGLPSAVGHGYPYDEDAYHLGWSGNPDEDLIHGIGFDYQYNGYAYGYGDQSWYGHQGISSSWPLPDYHSITAEFSISYDEAGRMVREELSYREREDEVVDVVRQRDFNAHGLVRDHVEVALDGDRATGTLHFERDDQGLLLKRWRARQGEAVAQQQWTYDDAHRPTSLAIVIEDITHLGEHGYYYHGVNPTPAHLLLEVDSSPLESRRHARTFDDQGRITQSAVYDPGAQQPAHQTVIHHGPHGPEEALATWGSSTHGHQTTYGYDDQGRLIEERRLNLDSGQNISTRTFSYDDRDRVVEETFQNSSHTHRVARQFSCH